MSRPDNNFDTLRMLAASSVLVSHAIPLTYGSDAGELFIRLSHGQTTAGSIAVKIFFIMSGYLVTGSYLELRRPLVFVAYRALRIVPALWLVLILLALVAGPLLTTLPLHDYVRSPALYRFLLRNFVFRYTEHLPGVLLANPFPGTIDGPLWTLRYEVACYGCVLLLGLTGLLRHQTILILCFAALAGMLHQPHDLRWPLAFAFFAGSLFRLTAAPRSRWVVVVCLAGWAGSFFTAHQVAWASVLAPYPVLMLATSRDVRLPKLSKFGDLSYGLYIYAFPCQQMAAYALGEGTAWYWNVAVSFPPALVCAYLSWRFVEHPALRLKARLASRLGA